MYPEIDHRPTHPADLRADVRRLAFIAAGALLAKRFGELGKPPDWAYEMAFVALLGGLIGSRLYF